MLMGHDRCQRIPHGHHSATLAYRAVFSGFDYDSSRIAQAPAIYTHLLSLLPGKLQHVTPLLPQSRLPRHFRSQATSLPKNLVIHHFMLCNGAARFIQVPNGSSNPQGDNEGSVDRDYTHHVRLLAPSNLIRVKAAPSSLGKFISNSTT